LGNDFFGAKLFIWGKKLMNLKQTFASCNPF